MIIIFDSFSLQIFTRLSITLGLVLFLNGCTTPQISSPSNLKLTFQSSNDLNPDVNGRPSPVDIRLYQLKNLSKFRQSQFFELYNIAKTNLKANLLEEHVLEIKPNENKSINLKIDKESQYLGILIAYYHINRAQWKDAFLITDLNKDTPLISVNSINFSLDSKTHSLIAQKEEE